MAGLCVFLVIERKVGAYVCFAVNAMFNSPHFWSLIIMGCLLSLGFGRQMGSHLKKFLNLPPPPSPMNFGGWRRGEERRG
jgi:hypothetical protein